MNAMEIFNFATHDVRVLAREGEPWFVLADICDILGIKDTWNVGARLDDTEKDTGKVSTPGGDQEMIIVNEAGVFRAILRSNKPEAEQFQMWLCHELLPKLRRTGSYVPPITKRLRKEVKKWLKGAEFALQNGEAITVTGLADSIRALMSVTTDELYKEG